MAEPFIYYALFNCITKNYGNISDFIGKLVMPLGDRILKGEVEEAAAKLIHNCQREGKVKHLIQCIIETCPQEKRKVLTKVLLEANKIAVSIPSKLFKKYSDVFSRHEQSESIAFLNEKMPTHELSTIMNTSCAFVVLFDSSIKDQSKYLLSINDYCNYFFLKIPTYFLLDKNEKEKLLSSIWKINYFDRLKWPGCSILEYSDQGDLIEQFISLMVKLMDPSNDWYCPTSIDPLQREIKKKEFDVFFCYSSCDKNEVIQIEELLKERNIYPYRDKEQILIGNKWIEELEKNIKKINTMAVFIGPGGLTQWQKDEYQAFLNSHHEKEDYHLFYVILNSVPNDTKIDIPLFLKNRQGIDLRNETPDLIVAMILGITGGTFGR